MRAVCYQCFSRGLIPGMEKKHTNRVSELLTYARETGEIPWEHIVQEGREIEHVSTWADPAAFARTVQAAYRRNKWAGQRTRVLVVSEKGTVRGTLASVLNEFEVDFLPVGGYASTTRVHELAQLAPIAQPGRFLDSQKLLLLYLGDHDPSGRGMSDVDFPKRLFRYASDDPSDDDWTDEEVELGLADYGMTARRIALTVEDTVALGPGLGFPASDKVKDSRYRWFVEHYGDRCWELDAMNPNTLRARVETAIRAELDWPTWERYVAAERAERESITRALGTWTSISGLAQE